ncbi:Eukaryotic translation initiation factor 2-alpha kinase 3 [Entophlyctis sp. JEL0112]|nr:Eukaryotic translation initiation factor 2-alpha kinase 3 [Entophlyctis sp. JEL0112]
MSLRHDHPALVPLLRAAYDAIPDPVLVSGVVPTSAPDAVSSVSSDARVLLANPAASELLGRDVAGLSLKSFLHNPDPLPTTAPMHTRRFRPVNVASIVEMFDNSENSAPLRMKFRVKPARGNSFEVDAIISQLSLDALGPCSNASDWRCLIVLTLKSTSAKAKASATEAPSESVHPSLSRYKTEFEELSCLGKGGFGVVYRARNRLDGIEYAIKKVKLSCTPSQFSILASASDSPKSTKPDRFDSSGTSISSVSPSDARLLNEIKLFARLSQHPNVVSYHTAWIESEQISPSKHSLKLPAKHPSSGITTKKIPALAISTTEISRAATTGSVTSQLSASIKSANAEQDPTLAPIHKRPQAEFLNFRAASHLSIETTNSVTSKGHDDDMIIFTNSEQSANSSSGSSSDQNSSSDYDSSENSDGEDLKRFVWRGRAGQSYVPKPSLTKSNLGGFLSTSMPSTTRSLELRQPSNVISTKFEDADTEKSKPNLFPSSKTLGSKISSKSTVNEDSRSSAEYSDLATDIVDQDGESSDIKQHRSTLYIQMQLCPFMDLRTFINKRRTSKESQRSLRGKSPKAADASIFPVDDLESSLMQSRFSSLESYDDYEFDDDESMRNLNLLIFKQIVEGLLHIHDQHVAHRDVKPDNIFVDENHQVFVGDFGLAKSLEGHAISPDPNYGLMPGSMEASTEDGTFFYMAPELLDRQVYTAKSDIYSLGIILFELFHPFSTEMERVVSLTEIKKNPQELHRYCGSAGMNQDIVNMLSRLLAADPSKRPSALEILLDPIFDSLSVPIVFSPIASTSPNRTGASSLHTRRPSSNFTLRTGSMLNDAVRQRSSFSVLSTSLGPCRISDGVRLDVQSPGGNKSLPRSATLLHQHSYKSSSFKFPANDSSSILSNFSNENPAFESFSSSAYSSLQRSHFHSLVASSSDLNGLSNVNEPHDSLQLSTHDKNGNFPAVSAKSECSTLVPGGLSENAKSNHPSVPNKGFSQLWGMLKTATSKPLAFSSFSGSGTIRRSSADPAPDASEVVSVPSVSFESSPADSAFGRVENTELLASELPPALSKRTLEKHGAMLHKRKSFQVVPTVEATPFEPGRLAPLEKHANSNIGKMFAKPPLSKATDDASADSRIDELENDVGVLLQKLAVLSEKQKVMEAELAVRGVRVVSDDENDGDALAV